jgi:methyltransferase (TIGR00027 family)
VNGLWLVLWRYGTGGPKIAIQSLMGPSMQLNTPSRTAQGAAMHRAAHQLLDKPPVFADPLALEIIGREAAAELREGRDDRALTQAEGLRLFIATRSRFTEDCLGDAMARGVDQYVLLGAGLDTFAYRSAREHLRVFEVDHPATQGWKRARLVEVGVQARAALTYAPVDFENETLRDGLARAGFDFARPAMFAWLGVTPYLTHDAVTNTLSFIASLAKASEVVFDYAEPTRNHNETQRAHFEAMAARVAASGEPFKSFYESEPLSRDLKALGFSLIEDWNTDALNQRYFKDRADGRILRGRAHLMRARV